MGADPAVLREAGLSWRKISTLRDLAERLSDGRLNADVLSTLPDELMAEFTAIPGIGPWTVQGASLSRSSEKTSSYQATSRSVKPGMAAPSGEYHQHYLEKHGRAS